MKEIKVGILGCGSAAAWHIDAVNREPGSRVAALCDIDPPRLRKAARLVRGTRPTLDDDFVALLRREELDVLLVLTPPALHHPQVRAALDRGLHVLCQMPLVTDADEGRDLVLRAVKAGKILQVAYPFPLKGVYRWASDLIADGKLGDLEHISARLSHNWHGATAEWQRNPQSAGGILSDSGGHLIDLLHVVTGSRIREVACFEDRLDLPVETFASSLLRFDGGRIGTLTVVGRGPYLWQITVVGSKATLVLDHVDQARLIPARDYDHAPPAAGRSQRNLTPLKLPPDVTPMGHFLRAVRTGDLHASNAERAIAVALVTEALHRAATERRAVKVG